MDIERIDISKFPLKHEAFVRKNELGDKLAALRAVRRTTEKAAKRRRNRAWVWSGAGFAAAMVAFAVFLMQTVTITTAHEKQVVTLPCGSTVTVAENSRISYKPHAWNLLGRDIELDGSAYFSVNKGNTFTVNTDCGNVSVLGTEFEILEQPNAMTVKCHDGRVKVTASGDDGSSVVLDKGECVEVTKTEVSEPEQIAASEQNLSEDETEEKSRIIEYNREPLMNVVSEIERCFEVTVKNKSLCSNLDYSGVFYTDDMDLTLEIVFSSCGFDYELIDENMIELKNIE